MFGIIFGASTVDMLLEVWIQGLWSREATGRNEKA